MGKNVSNNTKEDNNEEEKTENVENVEFYNPPLKEAYTVDYVESRILTRILP